MYPQEFLIGVIRPTLEIISEARPHIRNDEHVENLLLGTAVQESGLRHLFQIKGPARGVYQIEDNTHEDVWDNYLAYRPELSSTIRGLASQNTFTSSNENLNRELVTNLAYATAIARIIYYRVKSAIPKTLEGQAGYWKDHYNTHLGKGDPQDFLMNWHRHVAPVRFP